MDGRLLCVLIAKNFFAPGIEVDANYKGVDLSGSALVHSSGTFTLTAITPLGGVDVALEGSSVRDGVKRKFFASSLTKIDGMDPVRFAASCGIDENGEKIQEGKRRGRKPKNRQLEAQIEVEEIEDEADEMTDEEDAHLADIFG